MSSRQIHGFSPVLHLSFSVLILSCSVGLSSFFLIGVVFCYLGDLNEKRYFFGRRNVSNRTIRAGSGYWKYIRNKDKQVQTSSALLGVQKTLVFYRGKNRTRWVMHEYRLNTVIKYCYLYIFKSPWKWIVYLFIHRCLKESGWCTAFFSRREKLIRGDITGKLVLMLQRLLNLLCPLVQVKS